MFDLSSEISTLASSDHLNNGRRSTKHDSRVWCSTPRAYESSDRLERFMTSVEYCDENSPIRTSPLKQELRRNRLRGRKAGISTVDDSPKPSSGIVQIRMDRRISIDGSWSLHENQSPRRGRNRSASLGRLFAGTHRERPLKKDGIHLREVSEENRKNEESAVDHEISIQEEAFSDNTCLTTPTSAQQKSLHDSKEAPETPPSPFSAAHPIYPHHHHSFPPKIDALNSNAATSSSDHIEQDLDGNMSDWSTESILVKDIEQPVVIGQSDGASPERQSSTVLMFVYGTLKRGYCNHYNLETNGISYFQEGMTVHPYVMYLDSTNRSRPCLTDGTHCPINEFFKNNEGIGDLVCPFCCFRSLLSGDGGKAPALSAQQRLHRPSMLSSKAWGLPVKGELYRVDASLLPALDRFERVPSHYVRQTITVRGLQDQEYYHAEVYFNNTSFDRWTELLNGRFQLLMNYTLDHHRLYTPREDNSMGQQRKSTKSFYEIGR